MDTSSPAEPNATFVVRLWVEWSEGRPVWRGSIEDLQSGKRMAFGNLTALTDFILPYLATSASRIPRQEQSPASV